MADDYFDVKLAFNPETGNVVPGAEALIYAMGDETFSSPLPITDITGIPIAKLIASPTGVYPSFRVPSGEQDVMAVSGDMVTPITSKEGSRGEPGEPGPAGSGVNPAGSTAGQVLTSAGATAQPVWANSNAGIVGAPSVWPSTFTPTAHTHTASQISGSTTVGRAVLGAADAQAARAAIGAGTGNGTSNLALGTTATTAAAGNHSHTAATLPFTPTGTITATSVQDAILQAAATGGGGGGSSDTLTVKYASGAYPTQPSSAPAGITVRHFYGPTQYMGPTWPGVLDLYTYAELT